MNIFARKIKCFINILSKMSTNIKKRNSVNSVGKSCGSKFCIKCTNFRV